MKKSLLNCIFFTQSNIFLLLPSTLAEIDGGPSRIHQARVFQKGPVAVMVLEAMKAQEKGSRRCVMLQCLLRVNSFFVKVFNNKLKDKFTPSKIIMISKYYWHSCYLEVMLNFPGV